MRFILTAFILLAPPVYAGPAADALMQPGLWAERKPEELPRYQLERHLPAASPATAHDMTRPKEVEGGEIGLSIVTDQQRAILSLSESGTKVAEFPAASANPILLFFLENIMRSVATDTGGSPYYIRNRIRDALVAAQTDVTQGPVELILRPFAQDPNRDRLGQYADLIITLRYDAEDPARILELLADTGHGPDGYTEKMTLIPET